jgi:hypothetical protein
MPKHQPAEYKVTVIEGDEPLSEQAVQQVAKILLESKRKREEKNGKENGLRKLGNRTGDGMPEYKSGRKIPDRKVQRA